MAVRENWREANAMSAPETDHIDPHAALNWLEQCAIFFENRAAEERSEDIAWQASVANARNTRRIADLIRHQAARIAELEEKNGELEHLFDIEHSRSMDAIKRWREAHPGNDLKQPDLGALLTWLMSEIDGYKASLAMGVGDEMARLSELEQQVAVARAALERIKRMEKDVVLTPEDYGPLEAGPTDGDIWQAGATAAFKEAAKKARAVLASLTIPERKDIGG